MFRSPVTFEESEIVNYQLEPYGDSGFHAGMPEFSADPETFFYRGFSNFYEINLEQLSITYNNCEVCLTIEGNFLYMQYSGAVVCHRDDKPECNEDEESTGGIEPETPIQDIEDFDPPEPYVCCFDEAVRFDRRFSRTRQIWGVVDFDSTKDWANVKIIDAKCYVLVRVCVQNTSRDVRYSQRMMSLKPGASFASAKSQAKKMLDLSEAHPNIFNSGDDRWERETGLTENQWKEQHTPDIERGSRASSFFPRGTWYYYRRSIPFTSINNRWRFAWYEPWGNNGCNPIQKGGGKRPVGTPTVLEDEGMNCCRDIRDIKEMVGKIYRVTGAENDFPVTVPESFRNDEGGTTKLFTLPQLQIWLAGTLDELLGNYPIEIEIEDADPMTEGNQKETVKLPNLAEAIAEMYGLLYQCRQSDGIATNALFRLAAEVVETKNAALVAQAHAKALSAFSGLKGNAENVPVKYHFNFDGATSLTGVLDDIERDFVYFQLDDDDDIKWYLQQIMLAVGIIKEVHTRSPSAIGQTLDGINSLMNSELFPDKYELTWERLLEMLGNDGFINRNSTDPKPKVEDIDLDLGKD